jgi:hypothetical protein
MIDRGQKDYQLHTTVETVTTARTTLYLCLRVSGLVANRAGWHFVGRDGLNLVEKQIESIDMAARIVTSRGIVIHSRNIFLQLGLDAFLAAFVSFILIPTPISPNVDMSCALVILFCLRQVSS